MLDSPTVIAVAAHLSVVVRVLAYRKNGARHRHHISWAAWALVAVIGASLIQLALHARQVGFFEAAQAVLLAVFVYGVRGNVARLLCADEHDHGSRGR